MNLIQEQGASPGDYLFGPAIDEPLAVSQGGHVYYYAADALGSVTGLTDSLAVIQNTYLYDAWGQTRSQTGSLANPFTYTAREVGEAGTLFYRARYLSPAIGRFLSEDPLPGLFPRNLTTADQLRELYSYTGNDPLLNRDPLGFKKCGDPPKRGADCMAYCHAARTWALCNLHNNSWTLPIAAITVGGGSAAAAALCGGPPVWIGLGGAFFGIGVHEYLYKPAMEAGFERDFDRCKRRCEAEKCGDTGEGPCGQPPFSGRGPITTQ